MCPVLPLGNEPNVYEKTYDPYSRTMIEKYIAAITAPRYAAAEAKFCGPSSLTGAPEWIRRFAADFGASGKIAFIAEHAYPGGNARKVTDPAAGRDKLLSPDIYKPYPIRTQKLWRKFQPAATCPTGLRKRSNYYNGGALKM